MGLGHYRECSNCRYAPTNDIFLGSMQGGSPPSSQAAQGNQRRSLASGPYPGPVHGAVTLSNVPYNIYGGGPQAASSSTFSKESDMDADSPNEEDEAVEAMPPFYTNNENIPNLSFSLNPTKAATTVEKQDAAKPAKITTESLRPPRPMFMMAGAPYGGSSSSSMIMTAPSSLLPSSSLTASEMAYVVPGAGLSMVEMRPINGTYVSILRQFSYPASFPPPYSIMAHGSTFRELFFFQHHTFGVLINV
jgi:hypothetical protein